MDGVSRPEDMVGTPVIAGMFWVEDTRETVPVGKPATGIFCCEAIRDTPRVPTTGDCITRAEGCPLNEFLLGPAVRTFAVVTLRPIASTVYCCGCGWYIPGYPPGTIR